MIKAVYYIGVKGRFIRKSKLNSDIATSTNSVLSPDFSNTLDWFRSKMLIYKLNLKGIRIELSTPINCIRIQ
jgi:hypothetical protein